jgi:serine/threonine protein kinase
MEVCEGGDLATLIGATSVTSVRWRAVRAIALDVARALRHLHSRLPPLSHRDVRSANVFLVDKHLLLARDISNDEVCLLFVSLLKQYTIDEIRNQHTKKVVAKLADFGLARMVVSASAMAALESWTWMAPETRGASRVAYDERADVYSYAMLLYHLVFQAKRSES